MKITDKEIGKIEDIFGFTLYDWQKKYLKGETEFRPSGRRNGKNICLLYKIPLI